MDDLTSVAIGPGRSALGRGPAGDPPADGPGVPTLATPTDEARALWAELLDAFHDRQAARRLSADTDPRAGYRWRPTLALVLPRDFSPDRLSHRRDLAVALEVLASAVGQYNVRVLSDSPDAPRLFADVRPFSAEAVAESDGALVLGSRSLNDEVAAVCPSRRVAADPCGFRTEARRIVFEAGGVGCPLEPAAEAEVVRATPEVVPVFLDDDEEAPAFLEALRRLSSAGRGLRITLSSRADADFSRLAREALAGVPQAEVVDPPPSQPDDAPSFLLGNEPIALLTRHRPGRPAFLFRGGRFLRVDPHALARGDLYLHRGEEADAPALLARWLGRLADAPEAAPRPVAGAEPMVSIVVPVYDRTTELLRLAASIFDQDYPWIEVLFVSNGSPPETLEALRAAEGHLIVRRIRTRIIEMPRACGSATIPRDVGIRASAGELVCVLDSDDWLDPHFFRFIAAAAGGWRSDTIYYPKKVFRDFGRSMRDGFPWDTPLAGPGTVEAREMAGALRSLGNFLCNSGVCFPRALFDRSGGIDHRLSYGEDLHLWWRMALAGARAEMHEGIVNIALHPGNNELAVGEDDRIIEAVALANDRGQTQWL
ncbi:glycosyltransferase [Tautonia sociabilis]|uniref:Glycosyltransferase n=1 Tax=Tautonia sociabilis TaxID=2080755 RepID=A0A432MFF1_9BACT|nr:glycosyltransferase [Tautonia sociabilis]RUL84935.1 glycosyltransferase [Tautonia sociabilis]